MHVDRADVLISVLTGLLGLISSITALLAGARAPLSPFLQRSVGWYISIQPSLLHLGYRAAVMLGGLIVLIVGNCVIYFFSRWVAHLLIKDDYFPGYVQGIGAAVAFAFTCAVLTATYGFCFPKKEALIAANSLQPGKSGSSAGQPPMMSFTTEFTSGDRKEEVVSLQADASWKLTRLIGMRLRQGYRLTSLSNPRKQPSGKFLHKAIVVKGYGKSI